MNRGDRDFALLMYLEHVRRGEPVPQRLAEFIAEGVEAVLDDRKPWPLGKGGRPPIEARWETRKCALQALALHRVGVPHWEIAQRLGLGDDEQGTDGEYRTVRNHIIAGRTLALAEDREKDPSRPAAEIPLHEHGRFEYRFAIEDLLTDYDCAALRAELELTRAD